jgi:hypothetical protein
MPPIRSQNSQKRVEQEGRLLLAIQAIKNQELSSMCKAAEVSDVPALRSRRVWIASTISTKHA